MGSKKSTEDRLIDEQWRKILEAKPPKRLEWVYIYIFQFLFSTILSLNNLTSTLVLFYLYKAYTSEVQNHIHETCECLIIPPSIIINY